MSNADPAEKIIALIHALKIRATTGDVEAVEVLRKTGWHAAAALDSLAFWEGKQAREAVREVAEKSLSWPINYHVMSHARRGEAEIIKDTGTVKKKDAHSVKGEDLPETIAVQINLGGKTGYNLNPLGRPRELEPHHPTGWAFFIFGRMEKIGLDISVDEALKFVNHNSHLPIAPQAIHDRANQAHQSMESALRECFENALARLL